MNKSLVKIIDINKKDNLKKLILYNEPDTKYNLDILIKKNNYTLGYDKKLNKFFKYYNLYFDLLPDIQDIIINFISEDIKPEKNYFYIKRIRNIKRTRKEITYLIQHSMGKLRYS